jgi:hypothetical protein
MVFVCFASANAIGRCAVGGSGVYESRADTLRETTTRIRAWDLSDHALAAAIASRPSA